LIKVRTYQLCIHNPCGDVLTRHAVAVECCGTNLISQIDKIGMAIDSVEIKSHRFLGSSYMRQNTDEPNQQGGAIKSPEISATRIAPKVGLKKGGMPH